MGIRPHRAVSAVAVALLLTLGGCGTGADEPGVATVGGDRTASPRASHNPLGDPERLHECMREQGVELVGVTESDIDPELLDRAMEACRDFLPTGGDLPDFSADDVRRAQAYARCMRESGVPEFPDPGPDGVFADFEPPPGSRERMRSAVQACERRHPSGPSASAG